MKHIHSFLIILLFSCSLIMAQETKEVKLLSSDISSLTDNICKTINKNYVFPEKSKLICEYLDKSKKNSLYANFEPNKWSNEITLDIQKICSDKHLRIEYNPELEKDILQFLSSKKGAVSIAEEDILNDSKKNFHFRKIEILPANIGYIQLNGFAVPSKVTSKTINAAMQFVSNTDAIILDLRNNFGGNGAVAGEVMSYFFKNKTKIGKNYNRIEDKWTEQLVENDKAKTKGLVLTMPIYILTSKRTFSAAEGLAYNLKNSKNAIIVGDTTRGGAHLTRSFSLGNGFVAFIPYSRSESSITNTDWEGVGVIPTYAVDEDKSLLFAQIDFLAKKLKKTTDETEKKKLEYILNFYKSKSNDGKYINSKAIKFVGNYDYFEVSIDLNNQLLFMDKKNFKVPTIMKFISGERFQINSDYQIEFVINEDSGDCTGIKMFWDDGYEELIGKNK